MTTGGGPADLDAITEAVRQAVTSSQARAERRSTCVVCGAPIVQAKTGRPREYCGDRCKVILSDARRVADGRRKPQKRNATKVRVS